MSSSRCTAGSVATAAILLASGATAAVPPFTITSLIQSGQQVPGVGAVPLIGFGQAFHAVSTNNSGSWLLHVDTHNSTFPANDEALLRDGTTPLLIEGIEGFLSAPDPDYAPTGFYALGLNNAGAASLGLALGPGEFSGVTPTSAAMQDLGAVVAQEGGTVPGLSPGAAWAAFGAQSRIDNNDSNQFLIVSGVLDGGPAASAILRLDTDGFGNVSGQAISARVGEPSPLGGVWSTLGTGPHASAINAGGQVLFNGSTSTGSSGVLLDGVPIAVQGAATPVPGKTWGTLGNSSVDLNNSGGYVFRGVTAAGNGVWAETAPDVGDDPVSAERTFGNGPLSRIEGSLASAHDVDFYGLRIEEPDAFSASTVGGSGGDTSLYLFQSNPRGVVANNDFAAGIPQSRIDGSVGLSPGFYYLAVATPRSRPVAPSFNFAMQQNEILDMWSVAPASVALDSLNAKLYWYEGETGIIRRAGVDGTNAVALAVGGQISGPITIDPVGGKMYWLDQSGFPNIKRANLDGTVVEDVLTSATRSNTFAATGLAVRRQGAGGLIFWTRRQYGEIWRCSLTGGGVQNIIKIPPIIQVGVPGDFAPTDIAVDTAAAKIYWTNPGAGKIQRANTDGTGVEDVATEASPSGIAVDSVAGKVYWTSGTSGRIRRANLNGMNVEDVLATDAPAALVVDGANARMYWGATQDRVIRGAATTGAGVATAVTLGPDTLQRAPDGPASDDYMLRWEHTGSAGSAIAYQVALTGATFQYQDAMIIRNGLKLAAVGDVLPSLAPYKLVRVGFDGGPIEISDRGDVLWWGEWADPTKLITNALNPNRYLPRRAFGLFYNTDLIMEVNEHVEGISDELADVHEEAGAFQMSDDGRFAIVQADTRDPCAFCAMRYHAMLLEFDLPPINTCPCDWNQADGLDSQDFFDFLNDFFTGDADINGVDGTDSQDYFDFIDCFFTGCP